MLHFLSKPLSIVLKLASDNVFFAESFCVEDNRKIIFKSKFWFPFVLIGPAKILKMGQHIV